MNIFKQKVPHVLWLLPFLFLLAPAFAQAASSINVTVYAVSSNGAHSCYNAGTGSASCQAFVSWRSGSYSGSGTATGNFTSGGVTQTATCSGNAGGTGSSSCASPWVSIGGVSCRVHFLGIGAIPMDQASGSVHGDAICTTPPTVSLTASPTSVAYGAQSTLTWSSSGATSCTAGGPWSNSGTLSGSGLTNPITSNTTFTFQCTGPGGTSPLQSVTVGVGAAPVDGACSATHYSCTSGTSANPINGTGAYTWNCVGSGGGGTASCSEAKASTACVGATITPVTVTSGGYGASGVSYFMGYTTSRWNAVGSYTANVTYNGASQQISDTCTRLNSTDGIGITDACDHSTTYTVGGATFVISSSPTSPVITDWVAGKNAPYSGSGSVSCTAPPPPTISFSASPASVAYGARSTLTWSSSGATSCTAGGPWSNSGTLSGSGLTNPLTSNTTFTFQCTGPGGTSPLQSVTVGVGSAPSGTISATPTTCTIPVGSGTCSSTISWNTANTPSATVYVGTSAFAGGTSGTSNAPWIQTTPLVFTLKDSNGNALNSVNVVGQCALGSSWNGSICASSIINGTCGSANGVAYPYGSSSYSPNTQCSSGTSNNTAFPTQGTLVSWTCVGANGGSNSPTCSASQNVHPNPTISLSPTNTTITLGQSVNYTVSSSDVVSDMTMDTVNWIAPGQSQWNWQNSSYGATVTPGNGYTSFPATNTKTTTYSFTPTIAGTYTILAGVLDNNGTRWTTTPNYTLTVNNTAVTASFTASPNPIAYGGRSTLTWSSSGATSCTAGGPWSNSGTLSGSGLTNPLTSNTTFTFQCTGPGGTSPLQSVTVNVSVPATCSAATISQCSLPASSSGSSAGSCVPGSTGSCNYTCNNGSWSANSNTCAASCTLPWGGSIASGVTVTAFQSPSVTSPATCVSQNRTCTNGSLSGSFVNGNCIVNTPTATISAVPTRVHPGGTVNLTWSGSGGVTACTVTGTNGFFRNAISGTNVPSGAINSQTTFTVKCNPGTATDQVIVNVVPSFQEF